MSVSSLRMFPVRNESFYKLKSRLMCAASCPYLKFILCSEGAIFSVQSWGE